MTDTLWHILLGLVLANLFAAIARDASSATWTGLTENASYYPGSGMTCASALLAGSISSVAPDFNGSPEQYTSVAGWR